MKFIILAAHFLLSTLLTFILASIFQTQMVLAGLSNIDINIGITDRLLMTVDDLFGLFFSYGPIILSGLLLAFLVSKLLIKYTPIKSHYLYIVAGGTSMLVILVAMQPVLGVTLVAGARSTSGVLLQALAGMFGGLLFMQLRSRHTKPS